MEKEIRVAKVLSETRIVLNVGSKDGIKESYNFLVYSIGEEDIIDPVTGKSLGKLEYVKGKGHVIHLQENMCTIETFKKPNQRKIIRKNGNAMSIFRGFETETEEYPSNELEEFTGVIVGDYAKLI